MAQETITGPGSGKRTPIQCEAISNLSGRTRIFMASILKQREPEDGTRISVMSRHTKEDGKTPDERIIEGISFDEWVKEFAPPEKLVGAYYRGEIKWDEFEVKYIDFLRSEEIRPKVEVFAKRCMNETITIMCIEDTADKCHRRLLAQELQRYQPSLEIIHR